MRKTEIVKSLECSLTSPELKEFGLKAAENGVELTKVATAKKESNDGFKAKIDELTAEQRHLFACIISKKETRDIDCDITYRWEDGQKDIVRRDTGEIVETNQISESEQQEQIDLTDPKKDPKKDPSEKS